MEQIEKKIQRLRERQMQNEYYKNTSEEESLENSKTPAKCTLRKCVTYQSEPRSRKSRSKKSINFEMKHNAEQKDAVLKKNRKLWQSCFVNIENLTPNKLNMVKTVNSPLLQIKNALANQQTKPEYSPIYTHEYVTDAGFSVENIKVDENRSMIKCDSINRTKINQEQSFTEKYLTNDNTYIEENILNNTFTFLSDGNRSDQKLKEYEIDYIQNNQLNDRLSKCSSLHNETTKNPLKENRQSIFEIKEYDKENDDIKEETYNAKKFIQADYHKCENLKQNDNETLDSNDFNSTYTSINNSNNYEVATRSFNNITLRKHLIKNSDVDTNDTSLKDKATHQLKTKDKKIKNVSQINRVTNVDCDMLDDDLNDFNSTIIVSSDKSISNSDELKPIIANEGNSYEIHVGVSQDTSETPLPTAVTNFGGMLDNMNISLENSVKQKKSIAKRLSKVVVSTKPQRIANSSRISKDSRLSSVNLSRISKLSGTKAIQLYEFLTDKESDFVCTNDLSAIKENRSVIESPPHSNSTPKIVKQRVISSLLKKNSKKDKHNVTFNDNINITDNVFPKKISQTKMPNFALIHKNHFEKMENISDYKDRKNERAKLLLSGSKPVGNSKTLRSSNKKITKDLVQAFNKTESNVSFNTKTPHSINDVSLLTSTPPFTQTHIESFTPKNCVGDPFVDKKVKMNISPYKSFDENKTSIVMRKTPYKEISYSSKQIKPIIPLQVNTTSNCTTTAHNINDASLLTSTPFTQSHIQSSTPKNCIGNPSAYKSLKSRMCGDKKVKINISPDKNFDENKTNIVMRKTPYKEISNSSKQIKPIIPLQVNTPSNCTINSKPSLTNFPFIKENKLPIRNKQFSTNNKINLKKPLLEKGCVTSSPIEQNLITSKSEILTKSTNRTNHATGYTRFGFRVPVKPKKQDIIKAVVTKSRIPKNDVLEQKRTIIKGVRSNRRFDLLMSMRQKK